MAKRLTVVTLVADIQKFYEQVDHIDLRKEAEATGFNLKLLRRLCVLYSGDRTISYRGASSQAFPVWGTIIAGCSCATSVAKLLLWRALARSTAVSPVVRARNVVDDVSLQAVGSLNTAVNQISAATLSLLASLAEKKLPLSLSKTVFLANSDEAASNFKAQVGLPDLERKVAARLLGTDAADGSRRATATSTARRKTAGKRAKKLKILQSAGAHIWSVHRAGPLCMELWGCATAGLPPAALQTARVELAQALGKTALGTTVGLKLGFFAALGAQDLLVTFASRVIQMWSEAVWSGKPALAIMDSVLADAKREQKGAWHNTISPADVLLKVGGLIGWTFGSARNWGTRRFGDIDLLKLSPKLVANMAAHDAAKARDILAMKSGNGNVLGGWAAPIAWQPLQQIVFAKGGALSHHEKAALAGLLANTHWSQERLFTKGRARRGCCLACQDPHGSLHHWRFACPATEAHRRQHSSDFLRGCAQRALAFAKGAGEAFARGLFPDPVLLAPSAPFPTEGSIRWVNKPACGFLSGLLFTDGSAFEAGVPELAACGWAIVMTDSSGAFIAAAFGSVPRGVAPFQSSRDAEDYALRMLAFCALPPVTVGIDCLGSLRCLKGGKSYAVRASNVRAHLWGHFFATFDAEDVTGFKVKAHASHADVSSGATLAWMKAGSDHADTYAKKGASESRAPEILRLEILALKRLAKEAAIFAAKSQAAAAALHKDLSAAECLEPGFRKKHTSDNLSLTDEPPEVAEYAKPLLACPPCVACPEALPGTVFRGHCLLAAEVATQDNPRRSLLFCATCGAFAEKRPQLLKANCQGKNVPGLALQRRLLEKGFFPQSGSKVRLSTPCRLSTEQVRFLSDAAAGDSSDSEAEQPDHATLSRSQLLACYGLTPDLLAQLVVKERAAEEKRRDRTAAGHTAEDEDSDC